MSLVSVVIPIYKSQPSETEIKSFEQCIKILKKYNVSLVCPNSLDLTYYKSLASKLDKKIALDRFDDKYFLSIKDYNKLMLSFEFYERFIKFKYILIYQLDAWVFRDELEYWCNQKYDYIGAPWYFKGANKWAHLKEIRDSLPFWSKYRVVFKFFLFRDRMVGNGGFSLRKVQSHLNMIKKFEKKIGQWKLYEDLFWAMFVKSYDFSFTIPGIKKALNFSIESQPGFAIKKNNLKLPFGCHAWPKYDFWKQFIPIENNKIKIIDPK
jgi:hypothetical protein